MHPGIRIAALVAAGAAAFVAAVPAAPAQDADLRAKAKEIQSAYRDAVVTVKAAIKMEGGFMGGDQQVEATGTVVHESGMTVVSESALDPMSMFAGMFGGDAEGMEMRAEAGDVKIVLADGKEVPARVVLRDKDLDLAFLAPEEKDLKVPHVPMDKGAAAAVLDDLIVLGRLGKSLDRAPTVSLSAVAAVVKKPRTFYVSDSAGAMLDVGCPTFNAAGAPVGIFLKRRAAASGGGLGDIVRGMMPVILPCEDVAEVMKQALEAAAKPAEEKPAEEPKSETPKEPAPEGGDEPK